MESDEPPCSSLTYDLSAFSTNGIANEKAVSLGKAYILKLCGTRNKVGFASSNSCCEIYSNNGVSLIKTNTFSTKKGPVNDVHFSPKNDNILYSCHEDGTIKSWDTRVEDKPTTVFEENPETMLFPKPLLSFDVSCNDRVLCGGTESIQGDAFMLFWDIRSTNLLGAYWNSHFDDILQVKFHKNKSDQLATASLDGLVNIFDISELKEEDALQYSLNTECPIDKINIISDNTIACITGNTDVQLWNFENADQICKFSRKEISKAILAQNVNQCYVIDVYKSGNNDLPIILAGSLSDNGKFLRTLEVNENGLKPLSNYEGNKQIVRCSWYDCENDLLTTGGESGLLTLWKSAPYNPSDVTSNNKSKILSGINKMKIRNGKPY